MRVVFYMSDLEVGGLQRHAIDLAARLRRRGHFAKIVVSRENVSPRLLADLAPQDYELLSEQRMMLDPRSWPRSWDAVNQNRPDVVVGVGPAPINVLSIWKVLGLLKARTVCTYGTTIPLPRDLKMLPIFRWALARTDAMAYCSTNQARYWSTRIHSRRDMVIYNGVDTEAFTPATPAQKAEAKAAIGVADTDFVAGLLGTFRPEKNHIQLVQAAQRLRQAGIPAKVLFVGGGGTRPAVEAEVAAMEMTEHVIFAGEHSDVRPFIRAMDVGVLCSTAVETFSLSALEMLACGVPMIHSELGGAAEMVKSGFNGYLFPIGDTDRLVEALTALSDPAVLKPVSEAARADVIERFAIEAMVDQYVQLFQELTAA